MLKDIRDAILQLLITGLTEIKTIRVYSGELSKIGELSIPTPAILVHLPKGVAKGIDSTGSAKSVNIKLALFCVVKRFKNKDDELANDIYDIMDLIIDELTGKRISIGTNILTISDEYEFEFPPEELGLTGVAASIITVTVKGIWK